METQAKEKHEKGRCHKDQLDLCAAAKQKIQSTMSKPRYQAREPPTEKVA
jgi:hypothetical protein